MKLYKQMGMKLAMLLIAFFSMNTAFADNAISIEPFTIDNDMDVVNVPVLLDNTDEVAALQFNLVLPDELEVTGQPSLAAARKANGQIINLREDNMLITVISTQRKPFKGNSGAIMTFPVKVKQGMLTDKVVKLGITGIVITNGNGTLEGHQDPFEVEITLQPEVYSYEAYTDPEEMTITAGETKEVSVCIANNGPIVGLQMDVVLPEGFTVDVDNVNPCERCADNAVVYATNHEGFTRFAIVEFFGEDAVKPGTKDGAVFTFPLVATDEFTAEKAEISFKEFHISYAPGVEMKNCPGTPMTVINGKTSGISDITDDSEGYKAVYTLDGVKVDAPQAGKVNIIVTGKGEVKKVLSK